MRAEMKLGGWRAGVLCLVVAGVAWFVLGEEKSKGLFGLGPRDSKVPVEVLDTTGKTALRDAIVAHYHAEHVAPLIKRMAGDAAANPEVVRQLAEVYLQIEGTTVTSIEAWRPYAQSDDASGSREESVVAGDFVMTLPAPDGLTRRAFFFETGIHGRERWQAMRPWEPAARP